MILIMIRIRQKFRSYQKIPSATNEFLKKTKFSNNSKRSFWAENKNFISKGTIRIVKANQWAKISARDLCWRAKTFFLHELLKNLLIRLIATQALTEKRREENIFNNIKSNTSDECFSVLLRMPAKPLLTIERLSPIRALSHFTAFRCCITENRRKLADEC